MRIKDYINTDWKTKTQDEIIEFSRVQNNYPDGPHWEIGLTPDEARCIMDSLYWWKENNEDKKMTIFETGGGYYTSGRIFAIWKILTGCEYYSCDILKREEVIEALKSVGIWEHINFIQGNARKIEWNKEINFLFIDSEHSVLDAIGEYLKYRDFLPLGSVVGFHDFNLPQVKRAIDIAKSIDTLEPIFGSVGGGFGIQFYHFKWKIELGEYKG